MLFILEIAAGIVLGGIALCFLPLILRLAFISAVACVGGFIVLLMIGGIASMFTPAYKPVAETFPPDPTWSVPVQAPTVAPTPSTMFQKS